MHCLLFIEKTGIDFFRRLRKVSIYLKNASHHTNILNIYVLLFSYYSNGNNYKKANDNLQFDFVRKLFFFSS